MIEKNIFEKHKNGLQLISHNFGFLSCKCLKVSGTVLESLEHKLIKDEFVELCVFTVMYHLRSCALKTFKSDSEE